ncbi:YbfB/YjiJ family MFS transporter [Labrys monachus]|uniref:MFS family arabinose efflux permease n=1 Tax=Labrys monachus TaxID=217067 RepID=A0ABU0FDD7_9HYPH|nr:YbfB/YjiJ family MFS transporter [Labrys monachus]MDQ0392599.1 putative MFS family arabinose efflux permease [Labrys monachus]
MARNQPHSLAVGGLAALAAALGIGRFVYTPILPGMMADLGFTAGQAGLIASANYAGYLLGAVAAAAPMPLSRRLTLAVMLVASTLTTLGMAGLSSLWAMAAMRFAGGFASAWVMVVASGLVLRRSGEGQGASRPGLYFAGVGVGIVLSALLVAIVQGAGLDWRTEWLICGLVCVLLTGMAIAKIGAEPAAGGARTAPLPGPHPGGGVGLLLAGYGLFGLGYVVTATFLVAIIRADASLRAVEPVAWLVVGICAMFSVPVWLKAAARWGTLRAFAMACLVEAAGVAASAAMATAAGMLLAAALLGATFMGITALGLLAARERARGDPQPLLALMTAVFGVGQIVGPYSAGLLHDRTGDFRLASGGAALALVLAAILGFAAWARGR